MRFKPRGFTLIEILIVVAIIGLLAALLFPVFVRARENARRAACQSNMKQMGLAFAQYIQDYDERYPIKFWECGGTTGIECPYTDDQGTLWYHSLYPYTKSIQIWNCPSNGSYSRQKFNSSGQWIYVSQINYGWNESYGKLAWLNVYLTEDLFNRRHLPEVEDPAGTLVVTEGDPSDDGNSYRINGSDASSSAKRPGQMHFDGDNVLFADGHVKWLKQSKLIYPGTQYITPPGIWTLRAGD